MVLRYLNQDEILKVAINLEEEGYIFYTKAASLSRDDSSRKVFSFLAEEEAEHLRFFQSLDLPIVAETGRSGEIDDEISLYLRNLVDSGIFAFDPSPENQRFSSSLSILEFAVEAEKNSILFYSAIIDLNNDSKVKESLQTIIREEKKHLIRVLALLHKEREKKN